MINPKLKDLLTRWSAASGLDLSAYFERAPGGDVLLTIEDLGSTAEYDSACFKLQKSSRTGRRIVVPVDTDTGMLDHISLVKANYHPTLSKLFWTEGSEDYQTIVEAIRGIDGRDELEAGATAPTENVGFQDFGPLVATDSIDDRVIRLNEWWLRHLTKARAERDEAIEQLRQAKAEKLKAVRILTKLDPVRGGE